MKIEKNKLIPLDEKQEHPYTVVGKDFKPMGKNTEDTDEDGKDELVPLTDEQEMPALIEGKGGEDADRTAGLEKFKPTPNDSEHGEEEPYSCSVDLKDGEMEDKTYKMTKQHEVPKAFYKSVS